MLRKSVSGRERDFDELFLAQRERKREMLRTFV